MGTNEWSNNEGMQPLLRFTLHHQSLTFSTCVALSSGLYGAVLSSRTPYLGLANRSGLHQRGLLVLATMQDLNRASHLSDGTQLMV